MSQSSSDGDLFLSAISQSIDQWTELKHVIDVYGAGGKQASEKLTWMSSVLFDYFRSTPMEQLKYEINDYIETIVDNEFDFVPMDKSIDTLINNLLEYHSLWSTGQQMKMKKIMEERSKLNSIKREALAKESKTLDESLEKMVLSNDQSSTTIDQHLTNSQDSQTSADYGQSSSETNSQSGNDLNIGDTNEWIAVSHKRKNRKK